MSRTYDEYSVKIVPASKEIEVAVDERQSRAGTPVSLVLLARVHNVGTMRHTEKTRFDIIMTEISLDKDIVLEEDHCYLNYISIIISVDQGESLIAHLQRCSSPLSETRSGSCRHPR